MYPMMVITIIQHDVNLVAMVLIILHIRLVIRQVVIYFYPLHMVTMKKKTAVMIHASSWIEEQHLLTERVMVALAALADVESIWKECLQRRHVQISNRLHHCDCDEPQSICCCSYNCHCYHQTKNTHQPYRQNERGQHRLQRDADTSSLL